MKPGILKIATRNVRELVDVKFLGTKKALGSAWLLLWRGRLRFALWLFRFRKRIGFLFVVSFIETATLKDDSCSHPDFSFQSGLVANRANGKCIIFHGLKGFELVVAFSIVTDVFVSRHNLTVSIIFDGMDDQRKIDKKTKGCGES